MKKKHHLACKTTKWTTEIVNIYLKHNKRKHTCMQVRKPIQIKSKGTPFDSHSVEKCLTQSNPHT